MATVFGNPTLVTPNIEPTVPIARGRRSITVSERYSAPIINQNALHQDTGHAPLNNYIVPSYQYYQDFFLPKDFIRGPSDLHPRIPPLTGLSVFVSVDPSLADVAALDWIVQRYQAEHGWVTIGEGTSIGAGSEGQEVWFDCYFNKPIEIANDWLKDKFRFGIRGRNPSETTFKEVVPYENGHVTVNNLRFKVPLKRGVPYHFKLADDTTPRVLHLDAATDKVFHSVQRGITRVWATHPNPLARTGNKAFLMDGTTKLSLDGQDASLMFRLLAGAADEGRDFLGNSFRAVVTRNNASNVSNKVRDKFWVSKPNPSQFAVESLYFDMSQGGGPQTVDRILVDPMTPGVFFQVYWSDEGEPGTDEEEWDEKIWHRIDKTFQMKRRETHALPEPITARYIKIDFSHLQAKTYDPGSFHKPIVYKKHPKWVLDYFMARLAVDNVSEDQFVSKRVAVEFDLFDLAFNYYLDDLNQEPLKPADLGETNANDLTNFLTDRTDLSDTLDRNTFSKIRTTLQPYLEHPRRSISATKYLPKIYAMSPTTQANDIFFTAQSTKELLRRYPTTTNLVSTLDRSQVVIEKKFPVMFFFIPARHRYRLVSAKFTHNRAYFAGVKEISLFRERYTIAHDTPIYIDGAGDSLNLERGDFVRENNVWVTRPHARTD